MSEINRREFLIELALVALGAGAGVTSGWVEKLAGEKRAAIEGKVAPNKQVGQGK